MKTFVDSLVVKFAMQRIIVLCVIAFGCIFRLCSPGQCNDKHFEGAKSTSNLTSKHASEAFTDLKFMAKRMFNIKPAIGSVKTYGNDKDYDYYNNDDSKYDEDGKKLTNDGAKNEYINKWNALAEEQRQIKSLTRKLKLENGDEDVEDGDEMDIKGRIAHNFQGSLLKFRTNVIKVSNFMTHRRNTNDNCDHGDKVGDDIDYDRKRLMIALWWW